MNISPHFTLQELSSSQKAKELNLSNIPPVNIFPNLKRLANLLEQIRTLINKPLLISSAYRSPEVNRAVGSKNTNSQHIVGCAADFKISGMTPDQIVRLILNSSIEYDQIIREYDKWVHISIPNIEGQKPRKNSLIIDTITPNGRLFS